MLVLVFHPLFPHTKSVPRFLTIVLRWLMLPTMSYFPPARRQERWLLRGSTEQLQHRKTGTSVPSTASRGYLSRSAATFPKKKPMSSYRSLRWLQASRCAVMSNFSPKVPSKSWDKNKGLSTPAHFFLADTVRSSHNWVSIIFVVVVLRFEPSSSHIPAAIHNCISSSPHQQWPIVIWNTANNVHETVLRSTACEGYLSPSTPARRGSWLFSIA